MWSGFDIERFADLSTLYNRQKKQIYRILERRTSNIGGAGIAPARPNSLIFAASWLYLSIRFAAAISSKAHQHEHEQKIVSPLFTIQDSISPAGN
jgi:RES domain-containing protein